VLKKGGGKDTNTQGLRGRPFMAKKKLCGEMREGEGVRERKKGPPLKKNGPFKNEGKGGTPGGELKMNFKKTRVLVKEELCSDSLQAREEETDSAREWYYLAYYF